MKLLRLILLVLLSIAIPVNGFAAAPASACPMRMHDAAASMAGSMQNCCDSHDPSSQQKSCKPGQSCSVSGFYFALPAAFHVMPLDVARRMPTAIFSAVPGTRIAAIWHPPRQS
jgi:hypothetical protein